MTTTDKKYPIGGYAPGNYTCNCATCKTQFMGDKRAVQCEPCATGMVQKGTVFHLMNTVRHILEKPRFTTAESADMKILREAYQKCNQELYGNNDR